LDNPRATGARDVAAVVVASLAFATASPLARIAVGVSPVAVAGGRTAVAAVLIAIARPRATANAWRSLSSRHRWALVGAGLLLAAHFALFLEGLSDTSFPAAVALVSLEPLSVVLVAWAAFGIRPSRPEAAGVTLATLGALVVASGAGHGEHRLCGDVEVLLAVALFGGYVAAARGLRDAMPALPYAAAVYAVASMALLPMAFYLERGASPPPAITWIAILLLGLVPTLVGHTLVQNASRTVSPSLVALVSPGETVGSLLIGALLLRTSPSGVEAAGAILIVGGATIAIRRARPLRRARS
jgi:drug/metabolite transporter (DMT)-like permease